MATLDWVIVGLYLAIALAIGVRFTRRASQSTEDYFVAGRTLPWFVAGTSIVATTFSSDTPLVVAGISREIGIHGHWFWLSAAIGQTATVFFFAKYWRRTEAMTDIEFVAQRYRPGPATSTLRVFKVLFDGVLINCTVMASVTLAMAKICKALLNLPEGTLFRIPFLGDIDCLTLTLTVLSAVAVAYACFSGLYGVVYTDLLQFALAMAGSLALGGIVYVDASRSDGLLEKLTASPDFQFDMLHFLPDLNSSSLVAFTFITYITVTWWYRAPGNGYYVQRLLATRSERDSFLAFLWFNVCQYIIRPWPWIIVGLLSLHYLPDLQDPESAFPLMIDHFLPMGLKGIMVASLLAAFMSTIDTHLNWGTSYIVNDLYQPFVKPVASSRHYVRAARVVMLALMATALIVTTRVGTVLGVYKYLGVVFGGIGTVMIARWYWWRVNPLSEIAAIIASLVVGNTLQLALPSTAEADFFAIRVVITITTVTVVWVLVTLWSSPENPGEHTIAFYRTMRIPGPGWKRVAECVDMAPPPTELLRNVSAWFVCLAFLFSVTIGVGKVLLRDVIVGTVCVTVGLLFALLLWVIVRKMPA